ncbi:MAG: hypothetical protein M1544_03775 [Candidatus Marsarchaeota archaeon]|nr:hypothetical protein [Candidatus Marsarchaeota archaeon]
MHKKIPVKIPAKKVKPQLHYGLMRSLASSELSYLKKSQVLISGEKAEVLDSIRYFQNKNKKSKLTVLTRSKKELISIINSTSKLKGLRYALSVDCYTGLPDEEFGLILAYDYFKGFGIKKSISQLKEFYRITKPDGIVIVTGEGIAELLKKYAATNFSKAEIIKSERLSYLKLVKLDKLSLLPQ